MIVINNTAYKIFLPFLYLSLFLTHVGIFLFMDELSSDEDEEEIGVEIEDEEELEDEDDSFL